MEAAVELPQDFLPVDLPFLHAVELLFHVRRELHVDNIRKPLHHQPVDHLAERRRGQALVRL